MNFRLVQRENSRLALNCAVVYWISGLSLWPSSILFFPYSILQFHVLNRTVGFSLFSGLFKMKGDRKPPQERPSFIRRYHSYSNLQYPSIWHLFPPMRGWGESQRRWSKRTLFTPSGWTYVNRWPVICLYFPSHRTRDRKQMTVPTATILNIKTCFSHPFMTKDTWSDW